MIRIMRAVDTREQCNQKKRKQKKVSFESLQHTNAIILLLLEIGAFFVVLSKNGVCTPHSTSVVVRSKHVQRQK